MLFVGVTHFCVWVYLHVSARQICQCGNNPPVPPPKFICRRQRCFPWSAGWRPHRACDSHTALRIWPGPSVHKHPLEVTQGWTTLPLCTGTSVGGGVEVDEELNQYICCVIHDIHKYIVWSTHCMFCIYSFSTALTVYFYLFPQPYKALLTF